MGTVDLFVVLLPFYLVFFTCTRNGRVKYKIKGERETVL